MLPKGDAYPLGLRDAGGENRLALRFLFQGVLFTQYDPHCVWIVLKAANNSVWSAECTYEFNCPSFDLWSLIPLGWLLKIQMTGCLDDLNVDNII